ncbi:TPA: hypothetical protein O1716_001037 [Staphylococcus aureus]|nr:hypothetical protein [Staphylococcus aureus]
MITCLFGSSRKDGNSAIAVENLLKNLNVNFVNLYQSNIEKVTDNRHSKGANFHNDDYEQILIIGGDNPHTKAQPLVNQFKLIFEFMNITNYRFLIGEGNKPYDILNDSQFIKELANINLALKKGDIYD